MKLPKPDGRKLGKSQKMGMALIFVSVMLFSGIGIAGFNALSHWNPNAGHGQTLLKPKGIVSDDTTASWSVIYQSVSVTITSPVQPGQTVDITMDFGKSNDYRVSASAYTVYDNTTGTQVIGWASLADPNDETYTATGSFTAPSAVGTNSLAFEFMNGYGKTVWEDTSIVIYNPISVSISGPSDMDAGQTVTYSSSVSGGAGSVSYQWYVNGNAVSGATSSSYSFSTTSTGSYSIYVYANSDGVTSANSNTITLTVNSDPSISLHSNLNPSDAGQSIDFSTSVSGGSGSYTSYNYILYDGTSTSDSQLSSGSSSSFSYAFSSSGSYLLTYSVTDSNGYTATSSLTQNVNTDPSVTVASSQNPTDSGRTVEFTSSVSGGTPGYSYSWSVDGNTYTSQDINVSFSSSGSYSVELTVTDAADYSVSQSLTETVNSDPTVSASSNVSSADVNYPIEFSSTPSGGTGSYSYSWTLNGQQISTSQDFSYSFASSGSYTLTVTVTDSVGVQSSASVTVTINPNPSVSISSSQNPTDVGNSVTFSSSESGGTGNDTYVWYINGVQESTASSFSYSFSAAGTYYVNVTVTDSDGHSASYSLKETVNPDPSVVIDVVHNPTDVGIWANFSASISGGTGPFSYSWTINGESFTTAHVNYTFTASGTFPISLTVTDANGNTASASVNEVVNPDPTVAAEVQYSKVDQGINDTFYADVSGGTSPFNYTWSIGNTILNYSQEFHLNFSAIGTYDINLTVSDSLSERSSSSVSIKVIQKPSALIEGSNRTDVSTTTYWEGYRISNISWILAAAY